MSEARRYPLHHIALLTEEPEPLAHFYEELFGLERIRTNNNELGVRSVWLALNETTILMIERTATAPKKDDNSLPDCGQQEEGAFGRGWLLVALSIPKKEREEWLHRLAGRKIAIDAQSDYTLYLRDPDGNRIALSHYPDPV